MKKIILFTLVTSMCSAFASDFAIVPAEGSLSASKTVQQFSIQNKNANGPVPIVEAKVYNWKKGNDPWQFSGESADLLVSPKIGRLTYGKDQVFRVALKNKSTADGSCYRVVFTEQPPAQSNPNAIDLRVTLNVRVCKG